MNTRINPELPINEACYRVVVQICEEGHVELGRFTNKEEALKHWDSPHTHWPNLTGPCELWHVTPTSINVVDKKIISPVNTQHKPENVYEYTITVKKDDGTTAKEVLVAVDDEHAREEASYECEGEIIAVERGKFLYKND